MIPLLTPTEKLGSRPQLTLAPCEEYNPRALYDSSTDDEEEPLEIEEIISGNGIDDVKSPRYMLTGAEALEIQA